MNRLKTITARQLLGAAAAGLILTAAPVSALNFDPQTLQTVDEMIRKMQQETMQQQYASMPLRNELPGKMMNNMYQYASNAYRQNIQPQMVQVVIGSMKPWEFPDKFKQAMMPQIVSQVSSQIKDIQLQQMQEGIRDPSFPNVPVPGTAAEAGK